MPCYARNPSLSDRLSILVHHVIWREVDGVEWIVGFVLIDGLQRIVRVEAIEGIRGITRINLVDRVEGVVRIN